MPDRDEYCTTEEVIARLRVLRTDQKDTTVKNLIDALGLESANRARREVYQHYGIDIHDSSDKETP